MSHPYMGTDIYVFGYSVSGCNSIWIQSCLAIKSQYPTTLWWSATCVDLPTHLQEVMKDEKMHRKKEQLRITSHTPSVMCDERGGVEVWPFKQIRF